MHSYIIRRMLLMVPTFIGITLIFFVILQIVPGGPLEQEVMKLRSAMMGSGEVSMGSSMKAEIKISPKDLEAMKKFYGFDKPTIVRYLLWLGLWPREINERELKPGGSFRFAVKTIKHGNSSYELQKWVRVEETSSGFTVFESAVGADFAFLNYAELPDVQEIQKWYNRTKNWQTEKINAKKLRIYQTEFSGVLTGNLGNSYTYREPVSQLIIDRLHISAYFGIIGFILSYFISIPMGIYKAVHHNSLFDLSSSVFIFIGYAIPGFALGALLLVYFGGGSFWNLIPLGEFRSANFEQLSYWGKILNQLHHTIAPVIAYTIGSFATLTVLMKNSLIENLSQDYVRTAFAKGLSEKRVIFLHAVRNSLIPLATGIGGLIGFFLAGSYLIEKTFNIDGIGLLSYRAIIERDYPIALGFLVIGSVIRLLGNLISDISYAIIDPRIRFK